MSYLCTQNKQKTEKICHTNIITNTIIMSARPAGTTMSTIMNTITNTIMV